MISENTWRRYIEMLRKVSNTATELMEKYAAEHGTEDRQKLIDYAYAVATKYGEGSAALAAQMYDTIAELDDASVAIAEPAETAAYSEVAKTVNGTLKRANMHTMCDAVGSLVKKASADTMLHNANRDRDRKKAQFAWIPSGDSCPYCLMISSKGWQSISQEGLESEQADHIHSNCDCNFAVRFSPKSGVSGYNPDTYRQMFDDAEGDTWDDKMNYLRREQYARNKDEINAQKRAAYAEREG